MGKSEETLDDFSIDLGEVRTFWDYYRSVMTSNTSRRRHPEEKLDACYELLASLDCWRVFAVCLGSASFLPVFIDLKHFWNTLQRLKNLIVIFRFFELSETLGTHRWTSLEVIYCRVGRSR